MPRPCSRFLSSLCTLALCAGLNSCGAPDDEGLRDNSAAVAEPSSADEVAAGERVAVTAPKPDQPITNTPVADAPVVEIPVTVIEPPADDLKPIQPSQDGADLDADLDADVAAYVLARGAGPSQMSPDGSFIVSRLSLTGTRQLYVMNPNGKDRQQVTDGAGVTFFDISPTGEILFGADNNGDERENYFLLTRDEDGAWGKPKLVLPATDQGFRQFGGFSDDGEWIAYSSTERNGLDYDLYTAYLPTGEATRVLEGTYGNYVQAVSGDFTKLAYTRSVGEDSDSLHILDLETGEDRVLSDPDPRANHSDAGMIFVGNDALILATNRGREFAALSRMDVESGELDRLFATDADIDQIAECGERVLFSVNRDGFSETFVLQANGNTQAIRGLPDGVHQLSCGGDVGLVRISAYDRPGDLYQVDLAARQARQVYSSDYGELRPDLLIRPESVRLPARDGVEVQGLLYLPDPQPTIDSEPKPSSPKPPVVFMVHGGPTAQARPSYNATVQYLLSKGIAVFQTNVRGSTGFGRTYVTLDDKRKRLDSVRDLVDMLDYLESDGRVDTDRAAVMGGSYGAYMVNAVLADYPDAFDAGVALFGVGDWVTALEVASPALKASDLIEYGDISDPEWRAFYEEISPIAKADNIRVPVLYSHGAMDPRIDKAETEVMVRALRKNGVRADYILIPDEGHGWRKLSNQLFYQRKQAEFLDEVLSR